MQAKRFFCILTTYLISGLFNVCLANAHGLQEGPSKPKNVIIMIGDGMGPAYTSAYRYFKDDPDTEEIEETVFDRLLVGTASTYPAKQSGYVTDSAAAATALSSGIKTYNGAIGVDTNKQVVKTLLEIAKHRQMATGVVVTSQVNHATPAAFLTHNESRSNYDDIAKSYLTTNADVILGGGQRYFPESLRNKFNQKGYQYIDDISQLKLITKPKVLGLFADVQLPWAIDEPDAYNLSKMTEKALAILSQSSKGFVLLVEGSLIDWAGHDNDIVAAMGEMNEFANAVEVVEQFVRNHPDTLMIVTADHSTGGLAIGANGHHSWNADVLRKVSASPSAIAAKISNYEKNWQDIFINLIGFTPSEDEWKTLDIAREQNKDALVKAIKNLLNNKSNTGWTTDSHTGVDVQVFAAGAGARLFYGYQDNTSIAKKIVSLLPAIK